MYYVAVDVGCLECGELFDFEMEVKPILEVLVGRSVIQAQYELIEEFEREEYLNHKKKYEKKREFELNKLQRTEAKYIRQEEEKQRRFKQNEQRKINDIIMQKKLMSKVFSKHFLKNLKEGEHFIHFNIRMIPPEDPETQDLIMQMNKDIFDKIKPGNHLCHRMLNLNTGIHLHKIEIFIFINQKFK